MSPTVIPTKKPPGSFKGRCNGSNPDLINVKQYTGSYIATYTIFTANSELTVLPVVYAIFPHTALLNMWFVYLKGCFMHMNCYCYLDTSNALLLVLIFWVYTHSKK